VIDTLCGDLDAASRELALARAEIEREPEQLFYRRAIEIHAGHLELARACERSSPGERAHRVRSDIAASSRALAHPRKRALVRPPYRARVDLGRSLP
jgi:hypothetical protein